MSLRKKLIGVALGVVGLFSVASWSNADNNTIYYSR